VPHVMRRAVQAAEAEPIRCLPSKLPLAPLLRWAGGKQFLLPHLLRRLPTEWQNLRYCEPFFGAGSLFFALQPPRALLGDANPDLIEFYRLVKRRPAAIARALSAHRRLGSKRHYYRVRRAYNTSSNGAAQAARFLYLNKACFNGIYRVNQAGEFNVPYGRRPKPLLPSLKTLHAASSALQGARIVRASFEKTLERLTKPAFVYFDPPYPALSTTSFFAHYTQARFAEVDQARLAATWRELDKRGCALLMTNADTPLIRRLYRGMSFCRIPVVRHVSAGTTKVIAHEVVVANYSQGDG